MFLGIFYFNGEADRKLGERERERGMTCNKGTKTELNQGRWGYVTCAVTIQVPGHSVCLLCERK